MRHRAVGGAGDELAGPLDFVDELTRIGEVSPGRRGAADGEIALVDLLPHRGADHVAHRAGVLPGGLKTAVDRVGVGGIEGEEVEDARLIGQAVAGPEVGLIAEGTDQSIPQPPRLDRPVELQAERRLDRPGDILGPLDLAVHPEDAVGDAGEHATFPRVGGGEGDGGTRRESARGSGSGRAVARGALNDPGVLAAAPLRRIDDQ